MELEASQADRELIFRFKVNGTPVRVPRPMESAVRLDLEGKISTLVSSTSLRDAEKLQEYARSYWQVAIGPDIARVIERCKEFLVIRSDRQASSIPWEILHTGTDHLGILMAIGRQFDIFLSAFQLEAAFAPVEESPHDGFHALVIGDPTENLEGASKEALRVHSLFRSWGDDSDLLIGPKARPANVLAELNLKHYDVIHFAGHSRVPDNRPDGVLVLAKDIEIGAATLRDSFHGAPLVFLNSCVSDRFSVNAGDPSSPSSLVEAFRIGGRGRAMAVVGANAELFDSHCDPSLARYDDFGADFAVAFYQAARAGIPIGEALRLARHEAREKYGGTLWAPFVLYGDPAETVRFVGPPTSPSVPSDVALQSEGVTWERSYVAESTQFRRAKRGGDGEPSDVANEEEPGLLDRAPLDAQARQILQSAFLEMANLGGRFLISMHLVLGALRCKSPAFRRLFEDAGVDPRAIRNEAEAVCRAIDRQENDHTGTSHNVFRTLLEAAKIARVANREAIGDEDLVRGILACPGSSASELLLRYGMDRPSSPHLSTLRRGGFEQAAWMIILRAQAIAEAGKSSVISSVALTKAMCSDPDSILSRALARMGLEVKSESILTVQTASLIRGIFSQSVSSILERARLACKNEGRSLISEGDLFRGFFELQGGGFGDKLKESGHDLRDLALVFSEDGTLDWDCFDEEAKNCLISAGNLARKKGYAIIGRRHLLYGLLSYSKPMIRAVRSQKLSAGTLAYRLAEQLAAGPVENKSLRLVDKAMSADLVKLLIQAAKLDDDRSSYGKVDGRSLARTWSLRNGKEIESFLELCGVDVARLTADLDSA